MIDIVVLALLTVGALVVLFMVAHWIDKALHGRRSTQTLSCEHCGHHRVYRFCGECGKPANRGDAPVLMYYRVPGDKDMLNACEPVSDGEICSSASLVPDYEDILHASDEMNS